MGIFDSYKYLLGDTVFPYQEQRAEKERMQAQIDELQNDVMVVQEDYANYQQMVWDQFDSIGWSPLGDGENKTRVNLKDIKKVAAHCNALMSNPLISHGVAVRAGYIWGRGVDIGADDIPENLFTQQALAERERTLATDGNVFTAISTDQNDSDTTVTFRVPLFEIAGAVSDPTNTEQVQFYKRSWTVPKTNLATGEEIEERREVYYPSLDYYLTNPARRRKTINKVRVDWDYVIMHDRANTPVGSRWGIPDIMPVIKWVEQYKNYLLDQSSLVESYNQIAFKIQGDNATGLNRAATALRRPPRRDPVTGKMTDIGSTAAYGSGLNLQAMPVSGSNVDFSKGEPLAAMIAAGLDIPLPVLLSSPANSSQGASEQLDLPTLKVMETRQRFWADRFKKLFEFLGENDVEITFPPINSDSIKDRSAVLTQLSVDNNILHKDEVRADAIDMLNIKPLHPVDELPEESEEPTVPVTPAQGVSGGVAAEDGALHSNNEALNNRNADSGTR